MLWERETPVILYGAGFLGSLVSNYMKGKSNIIAFLDKRADEIIQHNEIPVYLPENIPLNLDIKKKCIIILCVKNVFDHRRIAKYLLSKGFIYIVTFEDNIFKDITNGDLKLPIEIRTYQDLFKIEWHDNAIIKELGDRVVAKIPAPLVFTNKSVGMTKDKWADWPIQALYPHLQLFSYYNGNDRSSTSEYVEDYCVDGAKRAGSIKISDRWKKNILESRQKVFANMDKQWQLQSSFFIDKAPGAVFNNGRFNLVSGKHRATFLVTKGAYFIPLNISKIDYDNFLNMDTIQMVTEYLEKDNLDESFQVIFHPYFYMYTDYSGFNLYSILRNFMPYLGRYFLRKGKNISELKIYSCTKNYSSFGRYFMQIGSNVDIEYKLDKLECLLNKLLVFNNCHNEIKGDYDIVILELEYHNINRFVATINSYMYIFIGIKGKIKEYDILDSFSIYRLFGFFYNDSEYEVILAMKEEDFD